MKKYIILILAALLLTACSSGTPEEEPVEPVPETPVEIPGDPAPEEELPDLNPLPDESTFVNYDYVELNGDPVYEDGILILHVSRDLWYEDDAPVSVGYIISSSAESMGGKIVTKDYPDMITDEGDFRGIAIRTAEPLPSGNCLYSVSFGEYMATFEMTLD